MCLPVFASGREAAWCNTSCVVVDDGRWSETDVRTEEGRWKGSMDNDGMIE